MRRLALLMALLLTVALPRAGSSQSTDKKGETSDSKFGKDAAGVQEKLRESLERSKDTEFTKTKSEPGKPTLGYMQDFLHRKITSDKTSDVTIRVFDGKAERPIVLRRYVAAPPEKPLLKYIVVLDTEREIAVWEAAGVERAGLLEGTKLRDTFLLCMQRDLVSLRHLLLGIGLAVSEKDPATAKKLAEKLDCTHVTNREDDVAGERKGD